MNDNDPFLLLESPCDPAVHWLIEMLGGAGLTVVRTFDLQAARHAQAVCPCPYHGTHHCDCQMVVLFIYKGDLPPLTLVAHGYNGQTWFSLVDNPQQPADPQLVRALRHSLASPLNLPPDLHVARHEY
jgi:hypothetical protein